MVLYRKSDICAYTYKHMGQRHIIFLLVKCVEIHFMISMSEIQTESVMVLNHASLLDKREIRIRILLLFLWLFQRLAWNSFVNDHATIQHICNDLNYFFLMNIYVCICILEFIKADHKRFYNKLHIPSLPWNYILLRAKFVKCT